MFARLTSGQAPPGRLDAIARLFQEAIVPVVLGRPGFQRLTVLANRATGALRVVWLWDTREALRASAQDGDLLGRLDAVRLLTGDLTDATFDVYELINVVDAPPLYGDMEDEAPAPAAARLIAFTLRLDTIDDAFDVYRTAIIPVTQEQAGFLGLLLCGDAATGDGFVQTVWGSEGALRAGQLNGYLQEQVARIIPFFAAVPTPEVFAVLIDLARPAPEVPAGPVPDDAPWRIDTEEP